MLKCVPATVIMVMVSTGMGMAIPAVILMRKRHHQRCCQTGLVGLMQKNGHAKKRRNSMKVLVTGGAGFIGCNLAEALINRPNVTGVLVLDNLATGNTKNIEPFLSDARFEFIEGDIRNYKTCLEACTGIDVISHQAALGSVPRSINDPLTTNEVNISGTLNIFTAAKEKKIKRVVYAASSSTYGDHPGLPKVEDKIGNPLSPYAVTKYVMELYAGVYASLYEMQFIGLRYFNIFGPKQNPQGPY